MNEAERRAAWLAERREVVTSTDLAALMGLEDAYSSPMGVYLSKKVAPLDDEVPEWMTWGLRLQPPIVEAAADRLRLPVEHADPWALARSPSAPFLGASLDARVLKRPPCPPLDAKNVGRLDPAAWGEDGTDLIPPRFVVQLHGQMLCTDTVEAYLAVLFGGRHFRLYRIERDPEIAAACLEVAARFWREHVEANVPPPVDGSEEWSRFLASRRQTSERLVESTPELDRWVAQLAEAREAKEAAEALEREAKNHLAAAIGEGAGLRGAWGRITYKATKDRSTVDFEGAFRATVPPTIAAQILPTFTRSTPGPRIFRFTPTTKEGKE